MALSMENLCKPRSLCVLKMVTMALSFVASAFLLIAALRIAIDRCRRVAAPPIGRVVDNLVLVLCVLDSIYYLPCLLVLMQGPLQPMLYLHIGEGPRSIGTLVYPHCRELVMILNVFWHVHISRVMYLWIVHKYSAARLTRAYNPLTLVSLALVLVCAYVVADNVLFRLAGLTGMAWVALGLNGLIFPLCLGYMLWTYVQTVRALRAGGVNDTFVPGRYIRTRRKLLLVSLVMSISWMAGSAIDMSIWAYMIFAPHSKPSAQLYPFRLITCRLVGIVDAAVLAGLFDMCLPLNWLRGTQSTAAPVRCKMEGVELELPTSSMLCTCSTASSGRLSTLNTVGPGCGPCRSAAGPTAQAAIDTDGGAGGSVEVEMGSAVAPPMALPHPASSHMSLSSSHHHHISSNHSSSRGVVGKVLRFHTSVMSAPPTDAPPSHKKKHRAPDVATSGPEWGPLEPWRCPWEARPLHVWVGSWSMRGFPPGPYSRLQRAAHRWVPLTRAEAQAAQHAGMGWVEPPDADADALPPTGPRLMGRASSSSSWSWEGPAGAQGQSHVSSSSSSGCSNSTACSSELPGQEQEAFDVYVAALQHCPSQAMMRRAIHARLGGPDLFSFLGIKAAAPTSMQIDKGVSAVLVFARRSLVERGLVSVADHPAPPCPPNAQPPKSSGMAKTLLPDPCPEAGSGGKGQGSNTGLTLRVNGRSIGLLSLRVPSLHGSDRSFDAMARRMGAVGNNRLMQWWESSWCELGSASLHEHTLLMGDLRSELMADTPDVLAWAAEAMDYHSSSSSASQQQQQQEALSSVRPGMCGKLPALCGWTWVPEHDELRLAMDHEGLLPGFREAEVRFPPTYRWRKGATLLGDEEEGTTNGSSGASGPLAPLDALEAAFACRTHRSRRNARHEVELPPSYHDRILVQSQPWAQASLRLRSYTLATHVTGGDHRPVVATATVEPVEQAAATARGQGRGKGQGQGGLWLYTLELCNFQFDTDDWAAQDVTGVTLLFPLPAEDPLAFHRHAQALGSMLLDKSEVQEMTSTVACFPWRCTHYFGNKYFRAPGGESLDLEFGGAVGDDEEVEDGEEGEAQTQPQRQAKGGTGRFCGRRFEHHVLCRPASWANRHAAISFRGFAAGMGMASLSLYGERQWCTLAQGVFPLPDPDQLDEEGEPAVHEVTARLSANGGLASAGEVTFEVRVRRVCCISGAGEKGQ